MQFGILGLWVGAVAAIVAALGILFGFDIAKAGAFLGSASWLLLIVLVVIEYRRRSKRFPKK